MSIIVDPPQFLQFQRPFNQIVKGIITITNTSNLSPIAFKVKTTAPKTYCVRPNSGQLQPGQQTQIQILLQQMKEDPPADYECKDKFLIQAIQIDQQMMDLEQEELLVKIAILWAEAEKDRSSLTELKLKCVFIESEKDKGIKLDSGKNTSESNANLGALSLLKDNHSSGITKNANFINSGQSSDPPESKISQQIFTQKITPMQIEIPAFTLMKPKTGLGADNTPSLITTSTTLTSSTNPAAITTGTMKSSLTESQVNELHSTIKKLTKQCDVYKNELERMSKPREPLPLGRGVNTTLFKQKNQIQGMQMQSVLIVGILSFLFGMLFF